MTRRHVAFKTPAAGRILGLVILSVIVLPTPVQAQEPWTDARVSERARTHAPLALLARGEARRVRGRVEGVGLHPNPSIDYERQESFAPNAQTQDLARVVVPFELSGRRDAARQLAELSAEESETNASRVGLEVSAQALSLFYRALAAERRVALLDHAQEALDDAARILASRESAGEASGYESARLSLEVELARSRFARSRLAQEVVKQELAALLGEETTSSLAGDFDVAVPPSVDELMSRAERTLPELASLDQRLSTARGARSAADSAWFPGFAVFGGYNRQEGPLVGHGYSVGMRVDIPLFDRGQGEQAEAEAAVRAVQEHGDALRVSLRAQIGAARARLEGVLAERSRFGDSTAEAVELVVRAAAAGFRGGERTLVELLDARRAALEVAERRVALDLAVRLADVELRRITGTR
ncbi:MAG: TolC family protein [Sandaracinaceae bacterium]